MADQGEIREISVDDLEFDLDNPRHEKLDRPEDVIKYLIGHEDVIELAVDIAKEGLNPLDILGVFRRKGTRDFFVTAEGNRRVCALKLLVDPERIPAGVVNRPKIIKRLERAVKSGSVPGKINVVVFKDKKSAWPWVTRMHVRNGIAGRRSWNPDQQERAMPGGRNKDAMAVLDLALAHKLISKDDRQARLTTVQRYMGNPTLRKALGIVRDAKRQYWVDRSPEDFALLMDRFLDDIRKNKLSSRGDAQTISVYGREMVDLCGVQDQRVPKYPMQDAFDSAIKEELLVPLNQRSSDNKEKDTNKGKRRTKRYKYPVRQTLGRHPDLDKAFEECGSLKLQSLYNSCVELSLSWHCPLITVGFWSIMESLAALHGGDGLSFKAAFNHQTMETEYGITNKETRKHIGVALERLTANGNATKHAAIAGNFEGVQLASDFDLLAPLMILVLDKVKQKKEQANYKPKK